MSLFSRTPREGDWIKTARPIKTTVTDYLIGGNAGIKTGTRGVVTRSLGWNSLEVLLDTGLSGPVTVRVKASHVRVTRAGGGIDAFRETATRIRYARLGVALAFVLPIIYFATIWLIHGRTKDGLIVALLNSVIYGVIDLIDYAISHPVNAIVYLGIVTAAGRFAFR